MNTPKPRHKLSNVDLERRTAICAVCGDTKIYVYKNLKQSRTEIKCLNKLRANNRFSQKRWGERKRLQNSNWKPRHILSQIDIKTMTGICAVCGPTDIVKRKINEKFPVYLCATKVRADWRRYHEQRQLPQTDKPSSAILAQQAQQQIIDAYKVEQGCKRCGYKVDPLELELHFSGVDEGELTMHRLVHFKRRRLQHALGMCEVYCVRCHPILHSKIVEHAESTTAV